MEVSKEDGLLYLHQIKAPRDLFVLRVAGRGLQIMHDNGDMTEAEQGLLRRVSGALEELDEAVWQGRADFPLNMDEAEIAKRAIRQATDAELVAHQQIVERQTAIANAAVPMLERYATTGSLLRK